MSEDKSISKDSDGVASRCVHSNSSIALSPVKLDAACPKDAQAYQRNEEEDRLIDFLVGLDVYYNFIKAESIGRTPLLDVPTAHARIQGEETRKHTMVPHPESSYRSAFLAILPVVIASPVVIQGCWDANL